MLSPFHRSARLIRVWCRDIRAEGKERHNLFGTDWDTGVPADPGSWTTTPAVFQEVTGMTPSDLSGISLSLTIAHSP